MIGCKAIIRLDLGLRVLRALGNRLRMLLVCCTVCLHALAKDQSNGFVATVQNECNAVRLAILKVGQYKLLTAMKIRKPFGHCHYRATLPTPFGMGSKSSKVCGFPKLILSETHEQKSLSNHQAFLAAKGVWFNNQKNGGPRPTEYHTGFPTANQATQPCLGLSANFTASVPLELHIGNLRRTK